MSSPQGTVPTFCHSPQPRMVVQPSDQCRPCPMACLCDVAVSYSAGQATNELVKKARFQLIFAPEARTLPTHPGWNCVTLFLDRIGCTFCGSFGSCCRFLGCVLACHLEFGQRQFNRRILSTETSIGNNTISNWNYVKSIDQIMSLKGIYQ